jgi:hypothetical protein
MTDTDTNADERTASEQQTESWPDPGRGGGGDTGESTAAQLKRYLNYAVLAGLILVALVSVIQLYSAVTRTINTFVVPEYRAPFLAAFNLFVLLVAALGISIQLARLQRSEGGEDTA